MISQQSPRGSYRSKSIQQVRSLVIPRFNESYIAPTCISFLVFRSISFQDAIEEEAKESRRQAKFVHLGIPRLVARFSRNLTDRLPLGSRLETRTRSKRKTTNGGGRGKRSSSSTRGRLSKDAAIRPARNVSWRTVADSCAIPDPEIKPRFRGSTDSAY